MDCVLLKVATHGHPPSQAASGRSRSSKPLHWAASSACDPLPPRLGKRPFASSRTLGLGRSRERADARRPGIAKHVVPVRNGGRRGVDDASSRRVCDVGEDHRGGVLAAKEPFTLHVLDEGPRRSPCLARRALDARLRNVLQGSPAAAAPPRIEARALGPRLNEGFAARGAKRADTAVLAQPDLWNRLAGRHLTAAQKAKGS